MPKTIKKTYKRTYRKKFNLAKEIKTVLHRNADKKQFYFNTGSIATAFSSAGALVPLSQITQGVANDQRIADQCRLNKLWLYCRFVNNSGQDNVLFRVIVWRLKSLTSALPSANYPIESALSVDYQTAMSPISGKTKNDVIILKDYMDILGNTASTSQMKTGTVRKFFINLKNIEQTYTGTLSTNQIYVSLFTQGIPTTTFVMCSRIDFYDI